MKKALLLATTGVALLLAGCSNTSTNSSSNNDSKYKTEMTKGNDAVDDENYSKAADYFASANEAKKTTKAKASEKQASNLAKAKKLMNKRQFDDAKDALISAKNQDNGSKKMVSRAKSLLSQVKTIEQKRSDYKTDLKTAKVLIKAGNNTQARTLLEQITKAKGVKGKYYSDLYAQAKSLLTDLPTTDTKSDNSSTTTDSNTNNSSDNSNSTDSNSSDSSSASSNDSGNPAANGDFDVEKKEVNGKTITADDIAKGRQQLTDAGVKNVGAWSDNDIVKAIKNAAADGRSTIKASDIKGGN